MEATIAFAIKGVQIEFILDKLNELERQIKTLKFFHNTSAVPQVTVTNHVKLYPPEIAFPPLFYPPEVAFPPLLYPSETVQ